LFYTPIYIAGFLGSRLVEDELETQAQMKIALSVVFSFLMYPILFFSFYAMFRQVPLGAAIALGLIWLIKRTHSSFIDENYDA
jgi:glycerol-3-phosphate O-acyltransferase/dihydroxyacetone phosphate acyltransferase